MAESKKRSLKRPSLSDQLEEERNEDRPKKVRVKAASRGEKGKTKETFLGSKASKKLLSAASSQLNEEDGDIKDINDIDFASLTAQDDDDDNDDQSIITDVSETESSYMQDEQVDEEDEKLINMFVAGSKKNLSDMIAQRMRTEDQELADNISKIKPEIVEVYKKVGQMLRFLGAERLPKAMKILTNLKDWEELLFITRPDQWAPRAMFLMTRQFLYNSNEKMCQRFFNTVLLPAVREDITNSKRLNFQLYMALKKGLYKIAAWFKGILLPLCEAGDCSLREAVFVSRVLKRNSLPPLHASVAILKIAQLPYSPTNSQFLLVLLDKRISLPYRVVDALVEHFVAFREETRTLPVLWHQCLLVFVRRYKADLTVKQKGDIKDLMRVQVHAAITAEINNELLSCTKSRGENDSESMLE